MNSEIDEVYDGRSDKMSEKRLVKIKLRGEREVEKSAGEGFEPKDRRSGVT